MEVTQSGRPSLCCGSMRAVIDQPQHEHRRHRRAIGCKAPKIPHPRSEAAARATQAMVDPKMATPPSSAVSFLCHRVSLGTAPARPEGEDSHQGREPSSAPSPQKGKEVMNHRVSIIMNCGGEYRDEPVYSPPLRPCQPVP